MVTKSLDVPLILRVTQSAVYMGNPHCMLVMLLAIMSWSVSKLTWERFTRFFACSVPPGLNVISSPATVKLFTTLALFLVLYLELFSGSLCFFVGGFLCHFLMTGSVSGGEGGASSDLSPLSEWNDKYAYIVPEDCLTLCKPRQHVFCMSVVHWSSGIGVISKRSIDIGTLIA